MSKEVGAGGRFDIFLDSAKADTLNISFWFLLRSYPCFQEKYIFCPFTVISWVGKPSLCVKPSAHSRLLSLPRAIFVFSSCRTQQTFIVARNNFSSAPS